MWPFSTSPFVLTSFFGHQDDSRPIESLKTSQTESSSRTSERPKPCCACPDTKRVRDDCFLRYGPPDESTESNLKCANLIAAHRACMAQYGYQI